MKYLLIVSLFIVLISCSSTKQTSGSGSIGSNRLKSQSGLNSIEYKGTIRTNMQDMQQSIDFKMQIAAYDSAALSIFGPLGMTIGKLYSTPSHFVFLNTFMSEAFEGRPTPENLKQVIFLPVSFSDLVSLFRSEPMQDVKTYLNDESYSKAGRTLYKSKQEKFTDFALVNSSGEILEQQRKNSNDKLAFTVVSDVYSVTENFNLARKIFIKFPLINGSATIEITDIKINPRFDKPFSFNLPSGVKKYVLD